MKKVLTTFRTVLLSLVFTTVAYAADPSADHSSETSELKLSPFDHLGHNMLLSAFGWPLGFHLLGGALTYKFSMGNSWFQ